MEFIILFHVEYMYMFNFGYSKKLETNHHSTGDINNWFKGFNMLLLLINTVSSVLSAGHSIHKTECELTQWTSSQNDCSYISYIR